MFLMTDIKNPCPICGQETEGLDLEPESLELKPYTICGSEYTKPFTAPAKFDYLLDDCVYKEV